MNPPRWQRRAEDRPREICSAALDVFAEKGFAAARLEEIANRAGVSKGTLYLYFDSKEAFGAALIDRYASYFARKLERHFIDESMTPLDRLRAFVDDAQAGMARHDFCRGCLIGNLGQEMAALPESFRDRLSAVFDDWEQRLGTALVKSAPTDLVRHAPTPEASDVDEDKPKERRTKN